MIFKLKITQDYTKTKKQQFVSESQNADFNNNYYSLTQNKQTRTYKLTMILRKQNPQILKIQNHKTNNSHQHSQINSILLSRIPKNCGKKSLVKQCQDQFLLARRQNHLNTNYNRRRNRLLQITKQNKNIYKRINAQKSFYSSRDLSKSRISSCSSSRKSISKNSRNSSRNGTPTNFRKKNIFSNTISKRTTSTINIETKNIRALSRQNINSFAGLFQNSSKPKENTISLKRRPFKDQHRQQSIKQKNNGQNYVKGSFCYRKSPMGCLSKPKFNTIGSSIVGQECRASKGVFGKLPPLADGMLHKIAEQFYQKDKPGKRRNKILC